MKKDRAAAKQIAKMSVEEVYVMNLLLMTNLQGFRRNFLDILKSNNSLRPLSDGTFIACFHRHLQGAERGFV